MINPSERISRRKFLKLCGRAGMAVGAAVGAAAVAALLTGCGEPSFNSDPFDEKLQTLAPQAKMTVVKDSYWSDSHAQEITINLNNQAVQEFITQARQEVIMLKDPIEIADRLTEHVFSKIKTNEAITAVVGPRNLASILKEGDVCFGKAFWLDVLIQQIKPDLHPRLVGAKVFKKGKVDTWRSHLFVVFEDSEGTIHAADPYCFRRTMPYSQYVQEWGRIEIVNFIRWQPD